MTDCGAGRFRSCFISGSLFRPFDSLRALLHPRFRSPAFGFRRRSHVLRWRLNCNFRSVDLPDCRQHRARFAPPAGFVAETKAKRLWTSWHPHLCTHSLTPVTPLSSDSSWNNAKPSRPGCGGIWALCGSATEMPVGSHLLLSCASEIQHKIGFRLRHTEEAGSRIRRLERRFVIIDFTARQDG